MRHDLLLERRNSEMINTIKQIEKFKQVNTRCEGKLKAVIRGMRNEIEEEDQEEENKK